MTEILLIFFSFIAIDEQTTAVTQSTCGVHNAAVNFVFKFKRRYMSVLSKKEYAKNLFFFALNTNQL